MVSMRSDKVPSEKRAWSSTPVLYLDRAAPFRKSRSICMKDEAYVISVSSMLFDKCVQIYDSYL